MIYRENSGLLLKSPLENSVSPCKSRLKNRQSTLILNVGVMCAKKENREFSGRMEKGTES